MKRMLQTIKEFLKRILPPPVKAFMREINSLRELILTQGKEVSKGLCEQGERFTEQMNELGGQLHRSDEKLSKLQNQQFQMLQLAEQQKLLQEQIVEELAFQRQLLLKLTDDAELQGRNLTARLDAVGQGQETLRSALAESEEKLTASVAEAEKNLAAQLTAQESALLGGQTELCTAVAEVEKSLVAQLGGGSIEIRKTLSTELENTEKKLSGQLEDSLELQNRTVEKIVAKLEEQRVAIAEQRDQMSMCGEESLKQLREGQENLQTEIKRVKHIIPDPPIYWTNAYERRYVKENWGDVMALPDFKEKFLRLTSGLDPSSTQKIIRIVGRQHQYLNSEKQDMNLFTREEQEDMRVLKDNFDAEILKLSDDLYAYRNYLLPVNHFESSVFYYKHGLADVDNIETVKGKAIIDVGGFVGDSVLVLSELQPDSIYTFEAVPENFELLQKTIELNNVPNVVAENMALGSYEGMMTVQVCGSESTSVGRPGLASTGEIQVPVTTLDAYIAEHPMEIGLIKVDIEGGEPDFLAGAKETICAQKPILLLSIYHNAHDFFELKPLIESWNLGYRFKIHKPTFRNLTGETLLIAECEPN